jgi:hypothetical protein
LERVVSYPVLADGATFALSAQSRLVPATMAGPAALANLHVTWPGGHWREGLLDFALTVAVALRLTSRLSLARTAAWLMAPPPYALLLAGLRGGILLVPFLAAANLLGKRLGKVLPRRHPLPSLTYPPEMP